MRTMSNEEKAKNMTRGFLKEGLIKKSRIQELLIKAMGWKEKQLIDKAAEWIDNNVNHYIFENEYGETYIKYTFTEDFIKAMKGE